MTVASQETRVGFLCKIQDVLECVGSGLLALWVLGGIREEEGGEGVTKKVFTECAGNRIKREGCKGQERGEGREEGRGGRREGEGEGKEREKEGEGGGKEREEGRRGRREGEGERGIEREENKIPSHCNTQHQLLKLCCNESCVVVWDTCMSLVEA